MTGGIFLRMKTDEKLFQCFIPSVALASVNDKYIGSPKYRNCREHLSGLFQLMNKKNVYFDGPVIITMSMKTRKDIDNNFKVIFDSLQDAGILKDDKLITRLYVHISRDGIKKGDKDNLFISITEVSYNGK